MALYFLELIMKKLSIALAAALLLGSAGGAFAVEATQDFPATEILSTKTRAEVKRELLAAEAQGPISYGEASPEPLALSTMPRAQVVAEMKEAQRLGLLGADSNEAGLRIATPAEQESIRQAGLHAIGSNLASSSH
jgi:hypothetical protein